MNIFEKLSPVILIKNTLSAKTRAIFAIFEPNAFPTAIFALLSKLEIIDINTSGDDVARPIKIRLEKK